MKAGAITETPPPARLLIFLYNQTNPSQFGSPRLVGSNTTDRTDKLLNGVGKDLSASEVRGEYRQESSDWAHSLRKNASESSRLGTKLVPGDENNLCMQPIVV